MKKEVGTNPVRPLFEDTIKMDKAKNAHLLQQRKNPKEVGKEIPVSNKRLFDQESRRHRKLPLIPELLGNGNVKVRHRKKQVVSGVRPKNEKVSQH